MKLRIEGDWWDSFIYAGVLHLVRADGSIVSVSWPRIVSRLVQQFRLDELAAELAFVDARYLYGEQWARLVEDVEIQNVIRRKFERLSGQELIVTEPELFAAGAIVAADVAPEAIADVEVHKDIIYFGSEEGLHAASRHAVTQSGHRPSARRLWDCGLFRIRAKTGVLALAAGAEGLFQHRAATRFGTTIEGEFADVPPLVHGDFFSCGWVGANIHATSYANAGTLAVFEQHSFRRERLTYRIFQTALADRMLFQPDELKKIKLSVAEATSTDVRASEDQDVSDHSHGPSTEPDRIVFQSRLEKPVTAAESEGGLSWGGYDVVCRTEGARVHIARFYPRPRALDRRFREISGFRLPDGSTEDGVVAGDVAPFGVIVETDDDLFVLSDGGVWRLGYEPCRWRTFSRATNYPNQLHVIGNDALEIHSFFSAGLSVLRSERRLMGRTRR